MNFSDLGLSAELLRAISEEGYSAPTPIQAQSIPTILAGHDLMAAAQTGTGKTAAFTLPLLHQLASNPSKKRPRALVLVPTRELAAQVAEAVRTYGRHLSLRCVQVFGGVNINPQIRDLRAGAEIVVATPGRLIDHMTRRSIDLSNIEILVLDEADRMLDMGFLPAIERIAKQLPEKRQTLLFSATFSDSIRKLARRFLREPKTIEVARRNATADAVQQSAYSVTQPHKRELLAHLFDTLNWQQALVFTRTKYGADRLAKQLHKAGIDATAIHGDKSQNQRMRALNEFKRMKVRALVATDVAARGIDIDELPRVVNFDLPNNPEDYVHRIGRTGRAGQSGEAISLVSPEERKQFAAIKKLVRLDIPTATAGNFVPSPMPDTAPPQREKLPQREKPLQRENKTRRHGNAARGSERPERGNFKQHQDRKRSSMNRNGGKHANGNKRHRPARQHAAVG